MYKTTNNIV